MRCDGHLILNTIDSVIPHLYETDRRTRAMENPPEAEMEKLELDAQRKAAKEAKKRAKEEKAKQKAEKAKQGALKG